MRRRICQVCKVRYSRATKHPYLPYLSYIQRLAVDKLFNSMEYNGQYEEVWLYVSKQSNWDCIKYLARN